MDVKNLLRSLKIARAKVRNILNLFNPSKYTTEVVKVNKDLWIKNAQDAFDIVTELSIDLEEFVSPAEAVEVIKSNETLMDEISKFVLSINTAALFNNDQHPVVTNFDVSEIQSELYRVQFPSFSGINERDNEIKEEDHDEQSNYLESEPRGSIPDPIKNLLLYECSQEAANEVVEEHRRSLGEEKDVVFSSVLQDLFKLVSVDQRFHRHEFNYVTLRAVLLGVPIQEMHVMLQMSSGSIQRSLSCITIDYIQLPLSRCLVTAMNIK